MFQRSNQYPNFSNRQNHAQEQPQQQLIIQKQQRMIEDLTRELRQTRIQTRQPNPWQQQREFNRERNANAYDRNQRYRNSTYSLPNLWPQDFNIKIRPNSPRPFNTSRNNTYNRGQGESFNRSSNDTYTRGASTNAPNRRRECPHCHKNYPHSWKLCQNNPEQFSLIQQRNKNISDGQEPNSLKQTEN